MGSILLIDDEPNILLSLRTFLSLKNHTVRTAETLESGWTSFRSQKPDMVILDIYLQGENGLDLLRRMQEADSGIPVVLMSGHADVRTAVQAVKDGAFDLLEKPIDTGRLSIVMKHAMGTRDLSRELETMKDRWMREHFCVAPSSRMQEVLKTARKVAPTDLHVLISGPNGAGKEPVAYYVYLHSRRNALPFVAVNCAAIPADLFESELFGYRKGAFTGASADRAGYFQKADRGTLFLDEIGELPLELQSKLLRVMESGEIQRLGGDVPEKIDVRIIAATNRDLKDEVRTGRFREDLYFRLDRIPLFVPPLEDRTDEIPGLVEFFMAEVEKRHSLEPRRLDPGAWEYLQNRTYRGNVRELRNLIERMMILSEGPRISERELRDLDAMSEQPGPCRESCFEQTMAFSEARHMLEAEYLKTQLRKHGGSVKETALALGMLANNLSRKISSLGIDSSRYS